MALHSSILILENGIQEALSRVSNREANEEYCMVLGPESCNFQGVFCKAEN